MSQAKTRHQPRCATLLHCMLTCLCTRFETGNDAQWLQAATTSKQSDGKEAQVQPRQSTGPRQPWWTGVMDRRFVGAFEPLAACLKSQVSAGGRAYVLVLERCHSEQAVKVLTQQVVLCMQAHEYLRMESA